MKRLVGLANDVGLLSEEYDVHRGPDGRQLPPGVLPSRPGRSGHAGGQGDPPTTRTKRTSGLVRETSVTALCLPFAEQGHQTWVHDPRSRVEELKTGEPPACDTEATHRSPARPSPARPAAPPARSTRFRTRAQSCRHNSGAAGKHKAPASTADPEAEGARDGETVVPKQAEARPEVTIPVPSAAVPHGRDHQHPGGARAVVRGSAHRTVAGQPRAPDARRRAPAAGRRRHLRTGPGLPAEPGQGPADLPRDRHRRRRGPLGDAHREHAPGGQPARLRADDPQQQRHRAVRPARRAAARRPRR